MTIIQHGDEGGKPEKMTGAWGRSKLKMDMDGLLSAVLACAESAAAGAQTEMDQPGRIETVSQR